MNFNDNEKEVNTPQDEPKIENDYGNRTEIEQPEPSTATPPIPQEIPIR